MKYLLLALLIFLLFWYYKKKRKKGLKKGVETSIAEMSPCARCGVYFLPREGKSLKKETESLVFCSEACLREYLEKKESREC